MDISKLYNYYNNYMSSKGNVSTFYCPHKKSAKSEENNQCVFMLNYQIWFKLSNKCHILYKHKSDRLGYLLVMSIN